MAYANDPRSGYHVHPAADSKHPAYFEEEDTSAILDSSILDSDNMQSPNDIQYRKGSFPNSNGVLSPADSHTWDHQYAGLPVDHHEESHNGFPRQTPAPIYTHQPPLQTWCFGPNSGHGTPTTSGSEFMPPPAPFERHQNQGQRIDSARASFSHAAPQPPLMPFNAPPASEAGFMPIQQVQTPMSPHSHQDWMGMAQQEMDGRPLPKRMRPNSPHTTMVDLARRDGIRKKNGRIDIPHERNIHTIDDMIDKTSDEDLLKELKQQKRLLRNREAALASRQRKKKHTEDLEHKEKGFAQTIAGLESELADAHIQLHNSANERQMLAHRCHDSQRIIEELREQMSEMKMQHNEETSSLRRKVNVLTDQLEAGPAPAMSAAPSSTGFTDFNAEMEALNMGPLHDWDLVFAPNMHHDTHDNFSFDSALEPVKQMPTLEKRPSNSTMIQSSPKKAIDTAVEQPVASGLLFMLLLCGAFIASKPASSQPQGMPKMPAEVCAAAPTVLNNLLSETGPMSNTNNHRNDMRNTHFEPHPSGVTQMPSRSQSSLDQMHHRLTSPSKQQEIDHAFSLTTAQYASITMDYPPYNDHTTTNNNGPSQPRRRLADALASVQLDPRQQQQGSKAEVYTRSLLWDQIPTDVVNQFRELVRDYDAIESRQQHQQQQQQQQRSTTTHDDMFGYKLEA